MQFFKTKYGTRSQVEQSMLEAGENIENLDLIPCYESRGHRSPPEICNWMIYKQDKETMPLVVLDSVQLSRPALKLVINNTVSGDLAS